MPLVASSLTLMMLGGCVNQGLVEQNSTTRTKTGAVIGAIGGAVVGATTGPSGKSSTKTRQRALIGAALGGVAGAGIGYSLDQQADKIARALGTGVNNDPLAALDPNQDLIVSKSDNYVKIMFRDSMMFAVDSATLQPSAATKVSKVGQLLQEYPQTIVQVAGFTDNSGSYDYNLGLSQRRASGVSNTLYNTGIQNSISAVGCSYNNEIVPNTTAANKALNRRVEVYLYADQNALINPCQ
ncbi:MAG TPA: OmpA family protein [Epsilonproteobacteria bacterium]|nr:OmpA family protein [Campylobacterota bacterium]